MHHDGGVNCRTKGLTVWQKIMLIAAPAPETPETA
jgi:hypothetical protein